MKIIDLIDESWSRKYKKSINCKHPRGFSQRAHCAGRKKRRAHGKTSSRSIREDMSMSQKTLAKNLAKLLQEINLVQLPTAGNTKSFIVDIAHRPIVVVNFGGHTIPFYCSTGSGGKATVGAGKWYPFWGISRSGWFNKGTEEMINKFYYSPKLARVAAVLDQYLGNLVGSADVKGAGAGAMAIINQNQQPIDQAEAAQDLIKYYARITSQVKKIGE